MDPDKGEVARRLHGASLFTVACKLQIIEWSLGVGLLTWPFECVGPSKVTEPCVTLVLCKYIKIESLTIADEVSITSVYEDWDLLQDTWYKSVEWLHPVTVEKEVPVDIKVA